MCNKDYLDSDSYLFAGTLVLFGSVNHGFLVRTRSVGVGSVVAVVSEISDCDRNFEVFNMYRVGRSLSMSSGNFKIELCPLFRGLRPSSPMCLSIDSSAPKNVEKL